MEEQLLPLNLPPGMATNGTPYSNKGRWIAGNLVRFFESTIRPILGWRRKRDSSNVDITVLDGKARGALSWRDNTGAVLLAIGTTTKIYGIIAGILADITPEDFTPGSADAAYTSGGGAYGKSGWGVGPYSEASTALALAAPDTWQFDSFGEELVGVCTSEHLLRIWTGIVSDEADTAVNSPSCLAVVTTAERFLVALGASDSSDGTGGHTLGDAIAGAAPDGRNVWWCDQESSTQWNVSGVAPYDGYLSGNQPLATNGTIQCGARIRGATLIWTDLDVWEMLYLGDTTYVYSFRQMGDHCGIIGPNAKAVVDGRAIWMGADTFYGYSGSVEPLQCEVSDSVFGDLNWSNRAKIWAAPITEFGEVWFFYPSAMSTEIDSYVIYNYVTSSWSLGKLGRTAGTTDGPTDFPVMVGTDSFIYEHETGFNRDGAVPYIESGPIELGNGDYTMRVQRIVPDEKTQGDVSASLYTSFMPNDPEVLRGPFTMENPTSVRFSARQVRIRFTEVAATAWRIGKMRLGVIQGGKR